MKIGILGSGNVAKVLGSGLLANGHEVMLGTRDAEKLSQWKEETKGKGQVGSMESAAAFGEVVFLCVHGLSAFSAIDLAGKANLKGKTVVDVTNPLDFSNGVPPKFVSEPGNSLGERIQAYIPEAHVVKAFNTISAFIMVNPKLEEGVATLTIAGNDGGAKKTVTTLAEEFGWDVVDTGDLSMAFWNETLAMNWIYFGFKYNHWTHAFKLLRK